MMNEYRFHLEKYRSGNRYTCPNCERKRCFTRYIDDEGEVSFPDNVANATMSIVVGITILLKTISVSIQTFCLRTNYHIRQEGISNRKS